MTSTDTALPDFERPPVVETVMGVRFRELPEFTSARIGQFWERHLRESYPETQDRPPYAAPVERTGPSDDAFDLQLRLSETPPPMRVWFLGTNQLVQLQPDWLAWNWRKTDDEPDYIRYARSRGEFVECFEKLAAFTEAEMGRKLAPIQGEVTYVNQVGVGDVADDLFGGMLRHVGLWAGEFLPRPEVARAEWSHLMTDGDDSPLGRLHVSVRAATPDETATPAFQMTLTARGRPGSEDLGGVLAFLDQGHDWIVRGFKDLTTERAWNEWGMKETDRGAS